MDQERGEKPVLEGTVSSIIFQNEENGYTILRLDAGEEEMTVVGSMPGVSPGEYLTVRGEWVRHATYGTQFRADVVERRLPQGLKEVYHYLASGAVKGVGKATARLLVEEFGEEALNVIEEEPDKLTRIRGISPKRARTISNAFRQQMGMRRMMEFLNQHQLPLELAMPLYRTYGDVALEAVRSNPYLLSGWEFGVDFSQADALALELGVEGEAPLRREAGLLFELDHNLNNGHSFLPAGKLVAATGQLLSVPEERLEESLDTLERRGEIVREEIAGEQAVYLPQIYEAEVYIAQRIGEMSRAELLPPDNLDKLLKKIQDRQGITYAQQQRQAVEQAAGRQVMLLTGGPDGRPSAWESCAPPRPLPSTACWRPALTPTPASWSLPAMSTIPWRWTPSLWTRYPWWMCLSWPLFCPRCGTTAAWCWWATRISCPPWGRATCFQTSSAARWCPPCGSPRFSARPLRAPSSATPTR